MNIAIKKWGNSQGIILPKAILELLHLQVNDSLELEVVQNTIRLKKVQEDNGFDDLIVRDLAMEGLTGEELYHEYLRRKRAIPKAIDAMVEDILKEEMISLEELE